CGLPSWHQPHPFREVGMNTTANPLVLVTGSSGFLGQAIIQGLLGRYSIIGLDARKPRNAIEGVETIEVDLTSDASVASAFEQVRARAAGRIASVIHLAAYYDTTGREDPRYESVTVQGTGRLLRALRSFDTDQ